MNRKRTVTRTNMITPEQEHEEKAQRLGEVRVEEFEEQRRKLCRPQYHADNTYGQEAREVERDNFEASK